MATVERTCDVAVLGGGLAGLTLAVQLKQERPATSIVVLEKRVGEAPEAAFKVGESTVELSAEYFANVLGMKEHMKEAQNPKAGLRFFFPADGNRDISRRVEWGSPRWPIVPAYQLDRGRFENALAERAMALGVRVEGGAFVDEVDLEDPEHSVTVVRGGPGGERSVLRARWIVDATGRFNLLKRRFDLSEDDGHHINSSWFRLAGGLDLEQWSNDEDWLARMQDRGLRKFSTNHLMGKGYWVWLIPLASGPISIGVVADPRFHPWERLSTFDALVDWLNEHEPQLGATIDARRADVEDFLKIENFSNGCRQVFSADRWCLTGEAGAFLDPLYSPGSDFIAMSNTLIADLIKRELDGDDVADRVDAYQKQYLRFFEITLSDYLDQYHLFGDAQVMCVKLHWDYTYYWSYPALWFFHGKLTDLEFLDRTRADFDRAVQLHFRMQELFRDWHRLDGRDHSDTFVTLFPHLIQISDELDDGFGDEMLVEKATRDREVMEAFAVTVWEKAARLIPDFTVDLKRPVNPYAVSLDPSRWETDGLFDESGISPREARRRVKGLQFAWLDEFGALPTAAARSDAE
ncbi:MAG: NAD(P)/FAD-dependent oxidoreductase [Gaiellaceae bacterium]